MDKGNSEHLESQAAKEAPVNKEHLGREGASGPAGSGKPHQGISTKSVGSLIQSVGLPKTLPPLLPGVQPFW